MAKPTARNHAHRGYHKQYAPMTCQNLQKQMVPAVILTQSKPISITDVRPVSVVVPKSRVTRPRHAIPIVTKPKSPIRRHITHSPSLKTSNSPLRVTTVKALVGNPQHALKDKRVIDCGCSRHMTGNMSYLSDFEELNGGYVAFGGNPKGGKISGKEKIKTEGDPYSIEIHEGKVDKTYACSIDPHFAKMMIQQHLWIGRTVLPVADGLPPMRLKKNRDPFQKCYNHFWCLIFGSKKMYPHSDESLPPKPIYDRYQSGDGYHAVPPPYTRTFMPPKPDLVFHYAPNVDETIHNAFNVKLSPTKPDNSLSPTPRPLAPIIEDWVSDSADDYETKILQDTPISDKSKLVPITTARPVTAAAPKPYVTRPRQAKTVVTKPNSQPRRHINRSPSPKASTFPPKVTAVKAPMGNPQLALKDKGVIDSGCSRHMTRNISYLSDFKEINGGYVSFGGNPKGGKISRKGKIRTGKLDFNDVYFVKELKFNLFSVSQMYDKKNSVLFTDTEYLVLSPEFKLPDKNQVLLRVPRENNMYNVDLKNIVPSGDLTCLFAKETFDESNLWHRRLGHINFKTMSKLVKCNLVRGLPTKVFKNDYTCVDCKKSKQHRASCKTKPVSSINQSLQRLHMDLFGPTFVKSLNKKSYCLVVTDNYSRFTWVFFLATKDDTSLIIKTFITDDVFEVKEPKFEGRKPESEVYVSPSNSAQSKKHDDKTKREAKGKSLVESSTGYRNLSSEFEDFSDNRINEVNAASSPVPAVGQLSTNSTNTFSAAGPSNTVSNTPPDSYSAASHFGGVTLCICLVRNVDSPTKFYMRVGKGFSWVETPLFESMLVEQQIDEERDEDKNIEEVNAGDVAEGDVSAANREVPTGTTNTITITSVMDTCAALTRRVEHLEFNKVAQALKITKLKRRVKKLEKRNKVRVLKLRRLQRVGTSQRVETSDKTVMDDVSNQGRIIAEVDADVDVVLEDVKEATNEAKEVAEDAKVNENVDIHRRQAESQEEIYKIDLDHANKVLSMQEDETEPAEVQEVVDVVITAKIITEVVTVVSETITAASVNITATKAQVPAATLTVALARVTAAPKDPAVKKYQALKRKPQTKAQARKNMMLYLKNVVGFNMDYSKGMSYDDIHLIFKAKFNLNVAFLLKTKEQIKEDKNRALQRLNETPAERVAKRRKLDEEVEELKRHLQIMPNKDDDVYTEATPLPRKVPVVDYQIIKLDNKPYYKIIRDDDTHQLYLILFVERKYPLTRFTLDLMLNAVRLEDEEESEVSLELLRFIRQQHQEGQNKIEEMTKYLLLLE
uniref:Putative ribonuclease H-like domain-containing protein n=1 Tax=Tanacetum cinerariifolium TaxID=118510 RepID=A0A6L2L0T1_TANCI|nr:putative ribonuclease H-like domain-containing protein [Tanacetum cinerariifolium]